jgi:hypothetical protein
MVRRLLDQGHRRQAMSPLSRDNPHAREVARVLAGIRDGGWLDTQTAGDTPAPAGYLVFAGYCSPACLLANPETLCTCACRNDYHGVLRHVLVVPWWAEATGADLSADQTPGGHEHQTTPVRPPSGQPDTKSEGIES